MSKNKGPSKYELRKKWFAACKVLVAISYVIFAFSFAFNSALAVNEGYSFFNADKAETEDNDELGTVENALAFDDVRTYVFADTDMPSAWTDNTGFFWRTIRSAYKLNGKLLIVFGIIAILGVFYLVRSVRPQILKLSSACSMVGLFTSFLITVIATSGRVYTFLISAFSRDPSIIFYDDTAMAQAVPKDLFFISVIVFFAVYIFIAIAPLLMSFVRNKRRRPHEF